ncbi:MAG: response regulator [Acetobacterium sp.]|nr:response regulator [Acetobacterium sp.]
MSTKILIVDDSTTDRLIISTMLADYHILTASDGLEAMELITKSPDLDLVILDLNMPRMNGFEVLEALQKDPEHRKIRTIILTNYDEIDNEVKGLQLGAVDYIRKPLNIQSLLIRINIHIKLKRIQNRIEQDNERLDALTSKRVYKPAYDFDYSIDLIKSECGKHFDPDIVTGFLEIQESVLEISRKFLQETYSAEVQ